MPQSAAPLRTFCSPRAPALRRYCAVSFGHRKRPGFLGAADFAPLDALERPRGALSAPKEERGTASFVPPSRNQKDTPEHGRFLLGLNPAVVPKPTDTPNRCNLGHVTPKTLQM
jgi:hypothetical protein